jgi:hypothetical protein
VKISIKELTSLLVLFALIVLANQTAASQYVCQPQGAPIVTMGSLTAGDPTQAGRINREGVASSCTGKTNAIFNASAVVHDAHTFTAPVTGCATVDFDATACGGATTQMVAYSTFNPATPGSNIIGDFGFSTTGMASFSFPVTSGQMFTLVVHDILETPTNIFCTNYSFTLSYRTGCRQAGYDRTNDGKADPTVFRPSTGTWEILNSAGGTDSQMFGLMGDIVTPGDYTGDGQTDVSTYRPSTNTWFYSTSQTSPQTNVAYVPWGVAGDIPVPGDFDRDGKTDIAIWRPSNGTWYTLRSGTNTVFLRQWGRNGDIPVVGDFDGDLINDFVVARPDEVGRAPSYVWYMLQSNFSYGFGLFTVWGTAGDRVVSGDFDGNAKTDIAVFRPSTGTWHVIPSLTQNAINPLRINFQWGTAGDIPQPADYDGDGRTDFAVFRPSTSVWYLSNSNFGAYNTFAAPTWGIATDQPATSPYLSTNP